MKAYKDYMDGVEVSPELHWRLVSLSAPAKRPVWQKYGAVAAALVLALGLGTFGAARLMGWGVQDSAHPTGDAQPEATLMTAIDIAPDPDIALAPPEPLPLGEGMKTIGGYEVQYGEGATGVAAYYMLPYIAYGEPGGTGLGDYSLAPPEGGLRDATREDFLSLLRCDEGALADHLDWGGYELSGTVGLNADGSVYLMLLYGVSEEAEFHLEVMPGRLPIQDCIVLGQEVTTTDVWGVEVAGIRNVGMIGDGERGICFDKSLRTEFMTGDVGVRCTFYGADEDALAILMSRFVRRAVLEGLDTSGITADGAKLPTKEPASVDTSSTPELPVSTPALPESGSYVIPSMAPAGPVPTPASGDFDPMTAAIPDRGTPPEP